MRADSTRQRQWGRAATALMSATLAAGVLVPVAYATTQPGPVFDVLGEQDGEPVVQIEGAPSYPTTGTLDLVTVLQDGVSGSLRSATAAVAWLLPTRSVEPTDVRYPGGVDTDREQEIDQALFDASTSSALAAAANYLGRPVSAQPLVSEVQPGSPAEGNLEPGDQVKAVNGQPTGTSAEIAAAVSAAPGGSDVTVDYVREGAAESVTITSGTRPDGSEGAYLGILLVDSYSSDFTAEVSLEGIGGPSAGLVFALAIVDRMTPGAMLDGGHVAGTGTIDAQGNVGVIGGIDKKVVSVQRSGAQVFLVPPGNCAELDGRIPEGLTVVPVATMEAAIDSIAAWNTGSRELPKCS